MYFDLYHGFPLADDAEDGGSKKGKKGKGKAVPQQASAAAIASGQKRKDCWEGLESADKDKFAKRLALAGHRELHLSCSDEGTRAMADSSNFEYCA